MSTTKGEWILHIPRLCRQDRPFDKRVLVVHPDGQRILAHCETGIVNNRGRIPQEEIEANARMMWASPKMLAALQAIVVDIDTNSFRGQQVLKAIKDATEE